MCWLPELLCLQTMLTLMTELLLVPGPVSWPGSAESLQPDSDHWYSGSTPASWTLHTTATDWSLLWNINWDQDYEIISTSHSTINYCWHCQLFFKSTFIVLQQLQLFIFIVLHLTLQNILFLENVRNTCILHLYAEVCMQYQVLDFLFFDYKVLFLSALNLCLCSTVESSSLVSVSCWEQFNVTVTWILLTVSTCLQTTDTAGAECLKHSPW